MGGRQKEMLQRCQRQFVLVCRNLSNQVTVNETLPLRRTPILVFFFFWGGGVVGSKNSQLSLTLETFYKDAFELWHIAAGLLRKACSLDFVPRPMGWKVFYSRQIV